MKLKELVWREKYGVLWNEGWKRHECYVRTWDDKMLCRYEAKILADGWQQYSLENYHEVDSKHNTRN